LLTKTTPTIQPLDDGLVLKSISTEAEAERVSVFNGHIHDDLVTTMSRNLILQHPHTRPDQWLYIEDTATGAVVSSLCLIPWTWRYEDVVLKSGEMGIVGTLESYRRRGLNRIITARHRAMLDEGEYDLSHIQGIPYYYRQFGYEYAIPLEGGWKLELYEVPDNIPETDAFTLRQATMDDIPALLQLYDDAAQDLSISAMRDAATWNYLLGPSRETETSAETWLVLDKDSQQAVGYWRIALHGFGEGLIISEGSKLSHAAALVALKKSKELAVEQGKPYLRLNIPRNQVLVEVARRWNASDLGTYAWQMLIPDVARLLGKLRPVFDRRIANSPFAGLTKTVTLNLYRQAYEMDFKAGKLATVQAVSYKDGGELSIPPNAFTPLVLGYKSRQELKEAYPDVGCGGQSQTLIDTLFPKVASFIYTMY
jgi:hypothetical protein